MSNAGYGNHDAPPPKPAEAATPKVEPGRSHDAAGASGKAQGTGAVPPAPERRNASTPGEGALPDGPQGDEVDPGVG